MHSQVFLVKQDRRRGFRLIDYIYEHHSTYLRFESSVKLHGSKPLGILTNSTVGFESSVKLHGSKPSSN